MLCRAYFDDLSIALMTEPIKEMPTLASAGPNVEMTLEKIPAPEQPEGDDEGNSSLDPPVMTISDAGRDFMNASQQGGNGTSKSGEGNSGVTGSIYSTDGKCLRSDGKNDGKVFVVETSKLTPMMDGRMKWAIKDQFELTDLDHQQLLDRANWIYAEGSYENKAGIPFWVLRATPGLFKPAMQDCIALVIKSKMLPDKDPTGGTTSWLGYKKGYHEGIYYLNSLGSRHFFNVAGNGKETSVERIYHKIIIK